MKLENFRARILETDTILFEELPEVIVDSNVVFLSILFYLASCDIIGFKSIYINYR
jgi:hypothetical protein